MPSMLKRFVSRIRREDEIRRLQERVVGQTRTIQQLKTRLSSWEQSGEAASRIIWIFGAGRSGSTWLVRMLGELPDLDAWFEPRFGSLLDPEEISHRRGRSFILAPQYRDTWVANIRSLILDGASVRFPAKPELLAIKDPQGSAAAPLLVEATPESRIILLLRDPRDVVSSWLDAIAPGGWQAEKPGFKSYHDDKPMYQAERIAKRYTKNISEARKAYENHAGQKTVIRYEDLSTDPLGELQRALNDIAVPVDDQAVLHAVKKHSWESVPDSNKGQGRFYRQGGAGGWRENLNPKQVNIVEEICLPVVEDFYY